jgi:hypothetical protein
LPAKDDCFAKLVQPIVEPLQVSRNEPPVQFDSEQWLWNWVCLKSVAALTTMSGVDDETEADITREWLTLRDTSLARFDVRGGDAGGVMNIPVLFVLFF